MKIETDIQQIEALAESVEDSNWEFRSYLKGCDLPSKEIDAIVHALYEEVRPQFDCGKCARCCEVLRPVLKPADVKRLAKFLGLSEAKLRSKYLQWDEEEQGDTFNAQPCPFLKDNRCVVYDARPENCRSYPYLQKKDFTQRLITVINNCSVCPVVFNVFERLKQDLWRVNHRGAGVRID